MHIGFTIGYVKVHNANKFTVRTSICYECVIAAFTLDFKWFWHAIMCMTTKYCMMQYLVVIHMMGVPKPLEVKSKGGNNTLVTNAGSNKW